MITRFSDARESYLELFAEATKRLHSFGFTNAAGIPYGAGANIETLEEYFTNLRNLVYGNGDYGDEESYKFLKLPLNEPHFEIEANSRTIKVPLEFQKYGISVVGDEVAEIVFFEVDRFYDTTDLYDTKIIIQWQAPGNSTIQYTPAFSKTTIIDPRKGDEKVIFGWPITSTITKAAGTLTFSVRFYIENASNPTQELPDFSLSTLVQKVNINPGLAVDILGLTGDDRLLHIIDRRIKNSPPVGEPQDPAEPVWIFYAPNGEIDSNDANNVIIDYQIPDEGLDLAVLGYKIDSGSLSYCWKRGGEVLRDFLSPIDDSAGTFVKVNKFIQNADKTMAIAAYYYKSYTDEFVKTDNPVTTEAEFQNARITYGDLYVRCSHYQLTPSNVEPGVYYAEIKNTLYNKETLDNPATRIKWTVTETPTPVVTSTSWDEDMTDTNVINEYVIERNNSTFVMEVLDGENLTENTSYIWEKSPNLIITNNPSNFEEKARSKTYTPTEEGYYQVVVENTQNRNTKSVEVGPVLLLYKIAEIRPYIKQTVTNINDTTSELAVTISSDRGTQNFETISYIWQSLVDGNYVSIDGMTTNSLQVAPEDVATGKYAVKVTVTKGKQSTSEVVIFQG